MSDPRGGRSRGGVVAVLVYVALLATAAVAPLAQETTPAAADSTAAAVVVPDTAGASTALDPPADRRFTRPARAASWITSDRFVDRIFEGEPVSFLYGNVYLDRDSVIVRADSARVYRDRDFVRLHGDVQARSGGARLASLEADYYRESGDADFRGEVRVWEDDVLGTADFGEMRDAAQMLRLFENAVLIAPEFTVRADTLVRDRREEFGEAFGDVRIVDPGAATLVTGRHARYADDGSWARVDRDPALVTREEGGTPVRSVARDMQFFRAEERVVMTDSVQIRQGLTLATADTAVVFGRERMLLTGRPEVSLGNDSRMRGDRISFFYSNGKLIRVILLGAARMEDTGPDSLAAVYTGLPELEAIEGDSIAIDFTDGEISRTVVVGSGQSVYVPLDVEDEVAFNEVSGDTIILNFAAGKVREVDVRGSMKGTYHFARLSELRGRAQADSAADGLPAGGRRRLPGRGGRHSRLAARQPGDGSNRLAGRRGRRAAVGLHPARRNGGLQRPRRALRPAEDVHHGQPERRSALWHHDAHGRRGPARYEDPRALCAGEADAPGQGDHRRRAHGLRLRQPHGRRA